jgi:hypothetical protein
MTKRFLVTNAVFAVLGTTGIAARGGADDNTLPGSVVVKLRDSYAPPTFNVVLGPQACVGEFRTTFEHFLTELRQDQVVGAWRFHPLTFDARKGREADGLKSWGRIVYVYGGEEVWGWLCPGPQ